MTDNRLRRLESSGLTSSWQYFSSAPLMSRIPSVDGLRATVTTTVGGRNELTVVFVPSDNVDVAGYELWVQMPGSAPTREGFTTASPAYLSVSTGTTGPATLYAVTVMKSGAVADLALSPTTTISLTA